MLTLVPGTHAAAPVDLRFVIGVDLVPRGLHAGDAFEGGIVQEINPALRFVVIRAEDAYRVDLETREDPHVRYVEVDESPTWILFTPNDPKFSQQYGPQLINAPLAWDTALGGDARTVCVVDTGIAYTHEELAPHFLGGVDFVNGDNDPYDDNGHGTHVAAIATGAINNGVGISGIANVGLKVAKVLNAGGSGFESWVASGIQWCADNGGGVISLSLGTAAESTPIREAVDYAWSTGSLVVVAAGNDGPCASCVLYPARHPLAIAVACVDSASNVCSFSARGPEVDVAAPGYEILSAYRRSTFDYVKLSGTSMSAPHVAGAAALLWTIDPALANSDIRTLIEGTTIDLGSVGRDDSYGLGLIDLGGAVDVMGTAIPYETLLRETFDDGVANGFALEGLWHVSSACVTAASSPSYLGYHDETTCTYATAGRNFGSAILDLDLRGYARAKVTYNETWQTEQNSDSQADVRQFLVSVDGGATWPVLMTGDSRGANQLGWIHRELNLNAFAGQSIKVRFWMDTLDPLLNTGRGWEVDDFEVMVVDNIPPVARAGPDRQIGDPAGDGFAIVALNSTRSFDPDRGNLTSRWYEGTTQIASGAFVNLTLAVGAHTIRLEVTDTDGATGNDTVVATVFSNIPPIAIAGPDLEVGDANGDGTQIVAVDGRGSTDSDGTVVDWAWFEGETLRGTGNRTDLSLGVGTHGIRLRVTDSGGASSNDTLQILVHPNRPPVARFTSSCSGVLCTLNATTSSDPDGVIANLTWTLPEGIQRYGALVQHSFSDDRFHEVTLAVRDAADAEGTRRNLVGSPVVTIWSETFDDGMADEFTLDGKWRVDSACATPQSPPRYLGFHASASCTYGPSRDAGSAVLPLDLRGVSDAKVRINTSWNLSRSAVKQVLLSTDGGATWPVLTSWIGSGSQPWTLSEVDISSRAGLTTQLRFWFDCSCFSAGNGGWFIDDLVVIGHQSHFPSALAGPDLTVMDTDGSGGETVDFDGSASFDGFGSLVDHSWALNGIVVASGPVAAFNVGVGTNVVALTVTDDHQNTATDYAVVIVLGNRAPIARAGSDITVSDSNGDLAEGVTLDGSGSTDVDGTVQAFEWTEGGVMLGSGARPSFAFGLGEHDVALRVTDNGGQTALDIVRVTVRANLAPIAAAGPDVTLRDSDGTGAEVVGLSAAGSFDPDGALVRIEWEYAGSLLATGSSASVSLPVGVYNITLRVEDNGARATTDFKVVTVLPNAVPVVPKPADILLHDADGDGGEPVTAVDGGSVDPDGQIVGYQWMTEGRALLSSGPNLTTRLGIGAHNIRLEVTDQGGGIGSALFLVTVQENSPPFASGSVSCIDLVCVFNATGSQDAEDGRLIPDWQLGDGTARVGEAFTYRYAEAGTYHWSLSVVDHAGVEADFEGSVTVAPEPPRLARAWAPVGAQLRDADPSDEADRIPALDIHAAWVEVDHNRIYAGIQLRKIDPTLPVHYSLGFTPDWNVSAEGQAIIRIDASVETSPLNSLLLGTLEGETATGERLFLGSFDATANAASGIVWLSIPRQLLQDPPEGAQLEATIAVARSPLEQLSDRAEGPSSIPVNYTARRPERVTSATFEDGDDGFVQDRAQTQSEVTRDPVGGRMLVVSTGQTIFDELRSKALGADRLTNATSFAVSAHWSVESAGTNQGASPLFLTENSTAFPRAGAGTIYFGYRSLPDGIAEYAMQYRDRAGKLKIDKHVQLGATRSVTVAASYDVASRILMMQLIPDDGDVSTAQYTLTTSAADGFRLERAGTAAEGGTQSANAPLIGAFDDFALRIYP